LASRTAAVFIAGLSVGRRE